MNNIQQLIWETSVKIQQERGLSLNAQAALQQRILQDGYIPVTSEFSIDKGVAQAAETLTGKFPRRVYMWVNGVISWFSDNPGSPDWPYDHCLAGVHGRASGGDPRASDYHALALARMEAIKHMSSATPEKSYGAAGSRFQMVRLFASFVNRRVTPADFVRWVTYDMDQWYNCGVRYYEIHNEPNLVQEGLGYSWKNGLYFADWWMDVAYALRPKYPGALFGFPGCSPGDSIPNVREAQWLFINEARVAIMAADWIGVHCYWQSWDEMQSVEHGKGYVQYAVEFPDKPLFITEFSNNNPNATNLEVGGQYCDYYSALHTDHRVRAAFAFVLSGAGWDTEAWVRETGALTTIPVIVGDR